MCMSLGGYVTIPDGWPGQLVDPGSVSSATASLSFSTAIAQSTGAVDQHLAARRIESFFDRLGRQPEAAQEERGVSPVIARGLPWSSPRSGRA